MNKTQMAFDRVGDGSSMDLSSVMRGWDPASLPDRWR